MCCGSARPRARRGSASSPPRSSKMPRPEGSPSRDWRAVSGIRSRSGWPWSSFSPHSRSNLPTSALTTPEGAHSSTRASGSWSRWSLDLIVATSGRVAHGPCHPCRSRGVRTVARCAVVSAPQQELRRPTAGRVTIWGRALAYGVALGVNRAAVARASHRSRRPRPRVEPRDRDLAAVASAQPAPFRRW